MLGSSPAGFGASLPNRDRPNRNQGRLVTTSLWRVLLARRWAPEPSYSRPNPQERSRLTPTASATPSARCSRELVWQGTSISTRSGTSSRHSWTQSSRRPRSRPVWVGRRCIWLAITPMHCRLRIGGRPTTWDECSDSHLYRSFSKRLASVRSALRSRMPSPLPPLPQGAASVSEALSVILSLAVGL